jgi:hypothetical protein
MFQAVEQDLLRKEWMTPLNGHSGPVTSLVFTNDQKNDRQRKRRSDIEVLVNRFKARGQTRAGHHIGVTHRCFIPAFSGDSVGWPAVGTTVVLRFGMLVKTHLWVKNLCGATGEQSITPVAFSKDQILAVATEGSTCVALAD